MKHLFFIIAILYFLSPTIGMGQNEKENGDKSEYVENTGNQSQPSAFQLAGEREKFEILHESLKEIYNDFIADVMKTLAFLILGIGWFVTSDKSRGFFRKNIYVRVSSIIALTLLAAIHVQASLSTFVLSQKKIALLVDLNYLGREYYESYEITGWLVTTNIIQNTILFIVLISILFFMKNKSQSASD